MYGLQNYRPLNSDLLKLAEPFLNEKELDNLPMACEGKSFQRIRVLELHKLIIRIATTDPERENLISRLERMLLAHKIIQDKGFNQIKIPKASIKDDYLIEKLLPCHRGTLLSTLAYYVLNHRFFDSAVTQFTDFTLNTRLRDTVGNCRWMAKTFHLQLPRYDNVKIYETCNKNGLIKYKIGLVDLENFERNPNEDQHLLYRAKTAVALFPYQYDIILTTCEKVKKFEKNEIVKLNFCREKALAAIEKTTVTHLNFLHKKSDAFTNFKNSEIEQNRLITKLLGIIEVANKNYELIYYFIQSDGFDDCIVSLGLLGNDPETTLKYCRNHVLKPMLHKLLDRMEEKIEITKNRFPCKDFSIMSTRVSTFQKKDSHDEITFKEKYDHLRTIKIKEIPIKKVDPLLFKPINIDLCNAITKSKFHAGDYNLFFRAKMMDLLLERGIIAQALHEEDHITILF